jgi:kinesin family protein C1
LTIASQDESFKQKESLSNELRCLRGELQQVRDDRDRQVTDVHALTAELEKFKECAGKSFEEVDNLTIKSKALEVCY